MTPLFIKSKSLRSPGSIKSYFIWYNLLPPVIGKKLRFRHCFQMAAPAADINICGASKWSTLGERAWQCNSASLCWESLPFFSGFSNLPSPWVDSWNSVRAVQREPQANIFWLMYGTPQDNANRRSWWKMEWSLNFPTDHNLQKPVRMSRQTCYHKITSGFH